MATMATNHVSVAMGQVETTSPTRLLMCRDRCYRLTGGNRSFYGNCGNSLNIKFVFDANH